MEYQWGDEWRGMAPPRILVVPVELLDLIWRYDRHPCCSLLLYIYHFRCRSSTSKRGRSRSRSQSPEARTSSDPAGGSKNSRPLFSKARIRLASRSGDAMSPGAQVVGCLRRNVLTILNIIGVLAGVIIALVLKSYREKWTQREVVYVGFIGKSCLMKRTWGVGVGGGGGEGKYSKSYFSNKLRHSTFLVFQDLRQHINICN